MHTRRKGLKDHIARTQMTICYHMPHMQKVLLIHTFYTIYMYSIMCGTYFVQLHRRQLCMPTTNSNNYTIENGNQTFLTQDFFTFQ